MYKLTWQHSKIINIIKERNQYVPSFYNCRRIETFNICNDLINMGILQVKSGTMSTYQFTNEYSWRAANNIHYQVSVGTWGDHYEVSTFIGDSNKTAHTNPVHFRSALLAIHFAKRLNNALGHRAIPGCIWVLGTPHYYSK